MKLSLAAICFLFLFTTAGASVTKRFAGLDDQGGRCELSILFLDGTMMDVRVNGRSKQMLRLDRMDVASMAVTGSFESGEMKVVGGPFFDLSLRLSGSGSSFSYNTYGTDGESYHCSRLVQHGQKSIRDCHAISDLALRDSCFYPGKPAPAPVPPASKLFSAPVFK